MYLSLLLISSTVTSTPANSDSEAVVRPEPPSSPPPLVQDDAAAEPEEPRWKGSFNLGFTFTDGNSEIRSLSTAFDANRESEQDIWKLRAWWNVQEDDGSTSQNDAGGGVDYNYLVTDRFYWLGTAGLLHDDAADLSLRWYGGAGAGYRFAIDEPTLFAGDLAVTYYDETFHGGSGDGYIAARAAYDLAHQFTDTTQLKQLAEIFPSLEDVEDVYARVDTTVRVDVSETFFGQVQYVFDWDNTPAAGNERADHKFIVGIGWTFGG